MERTATDGARGDGLQVTEAAAPPATAGRENPEVDPRRWIALGVVLVASFMVLLDISIVNVAIPTIQANLSASFAQVQLVLAGYQLAYAVMLITGGRLGDIFGRKRLFIIGVTGFTLASAACGLAQSPTQLVASRVIQGLFAALMYPQVLSVIQVSFPPRERGKAFGTFGGVVGVATITGPLAGGLLVKLGVLDGWRPIFLVNVPIGIGAVVAAAVLLHESRAPRRPRLDLVGVLIISAGLGLLVWPLVVGREEGWPLWAYACMVASVPVIALFGAYIMIRGRRDSESPLIDPRLFADRAFVVGLGITMAFFAGIPAFFFTISLFLQLGLGFSALHAGLTTIPFAIGSAAASGVSIRLAPKIGKVILSVGSATLVGGMLLMMATIAHVGATITTVDLIPAMLLSGVGLGLTVAPLINVILAGIQSHSAGAASGVLTTVQQVGGAIGIALIGVIFFALLGGHAAMAAAGVHPQLEQRLTTAGLPAPLRSTVQRNFDTCFHDRATAADPTVTPDSCRTAQRLGGSTGSGGVVPAGSRPAEPSKSPPGVVAIGPAVTNAATAATGDNFVDAMWRSLLFEVGVFALTFLLILGLPQLARSTLNQA